MDEVGQRLKDTSETCLKCYEEWIKDKKKRENIEALQESVHELRRVASRLEIDLAINEREDVVQKPMPIPHHRDSQRKAQSADDTVGNRGGPNMQMSSGPKIEQKGPRRRRPPTKKVES